MLKQNKSINKIFAITAKIQREFPALYGYLNETPLVLSSYKQKEISVKDYEQYLESITLQMNVFNKSK